MRVHARLPSRRRGAHPHLGQAQFLTLIPSAVSLFTSIFGGPDTTWQKSLPRRGQTCVKSLFLPAHQQVCLNQCVNIHKTGQFNRCFMPMIRDELMQQISQIVPNVPANPAAGGIHLEPMPQGASQLMWLQPDGTFHQFDPSTVSDETLEQLAYNEEAPGHYDIAASGLLAPSMGQISPIGPPPVPTQQAVPTAGAGPSGTSPGGAPSSVAAGGDLFSGNIMTTILIALIAGGIVAVATSI